ncbi:MAG: hypothetical protein IPJ84_05075 [Bdellovibrionales bacterium]|nr:hypothetical protein [Bdellovibrionales bacterium]
MKLNSQTALKAGLFIALAANMNWGVQSMNASSLASESVPAGKAATPSQASGDAKPNSQTPAILVVKAEGPKPEAAKPETAKPRLPSDDEDKKICGDTYQVHYEEIQRGGVSYTEITFKRTGTSDWSDPTTKKGQLHELFKNKGSVDSLVTTLVKEQRKENKLSCADAKQEQMSENSGRDEKDAEEKAREQKRIADGVKNCTLDKTGERIKNSEKLRCWLDRLADADKLDKKKDRKVSRRSRDDFDDDMEGKQVLANIKEIVRGPLRKLIKEMTLSTDESKQNEGIEAAEEASEIVLELASANDLGTNRRGGYNNDISKLIGELSALKTGGQTAQKSREMEDDVRSVRDQMRSSWAEYKRDPTNMWAAQEWNNARMMHTQLANQMNSEIGNQFIAPLQAYRQMGFLTAEDYREFTSPFTNMRNMMIAALNPESQQLANLSGRSFTGTISSPAMGSDIVIPTDLGTVRSQSSSGRTNSGFVIPTSPPPSLPRQLFNSSSVPATSGRGI